MRCKTWMAMTVLCLSMACHEVVEVTPDPARAGDTVQVSGSGFGDLQDASELLYDGAALEVLSWSDTAIEAVLPAPKAAGSYALAVVVHGRPATVTHAIESAPYQVGIEAIEDDGSARSVLWADLDDEPGLVALGWSVAAGVGTADGWIELQVAGGPIVRLDDLDNDQLDVRRVRWGAVAGVDPGSTGIYYLDQFESFRSSAIDRAPVDAIFQDGLESGGASQWSLIAGTAPLDVSMAAALGGSNFGLEIFLPESTEVVYLQDQSPAAETTYGARFLMDPNGAVIEAGQSHTIFDARNADGPIFRVLLRSGP